MPSKHVTQQMGSGDRFYFPDIKHEEYIISLFDRALNHKPGKRAIDQYLPEMSDEDVRLIQKFISEIQATRHITVKRKFKIAYILVHWREFIGEFTKNTISDIYEGINNIQTAKNNGGGPRYAPNTLMDYCGFLKRFYLWLIEEGLSTIPERKIRAIKPPKPNTMTKTAEMLLSEDEVRRLIEACQNSKDRALISMLYEGGFRIGELALLKWNQIKFNEWNVAVNLNFKTGKTRHIPLVVSRSYLAQWKQDYPLPITPEGFVFITAGRHEQLQYRGLRKQLEIIRQRAKVEKKLTPHIFRHSRITHLIRQGVSESVIKKMAWGDINSKMFGTYAHLTESDTDNEIAKLNGIQPMQKKAISKALEPRQCPQCYTINGPTIRFCGECGMGLDEDAIADLMKSRSEMDNQYKKMKHDPKMFEEFVEFQKWKATKAIKSD